MKELGEGGVRVQLCIQCKHPDGRQGTFLRDENGATSPRFDDFVALLPWMGRNGWKPVPGTAFDVERVKPHDGT